ncbi:MAG TPA: VOC family protein, partial [Blastocatellia bacterium]|nr:VOC family protein [Blastocatellia bacterium]
HFGHLHLFSDDPVSTGLWYIKYFGAVRRGGATAPPSREPRYYKGFQVGPSMSLMVDNVNIIIFPAEHARQSYPDQWKGRTGFAPTAGRVIDHIAFSFDNLGEAVRRLRADGVTITGDIGDAYEGRMRRAFIEGPDKVRIELVEGSAHRD